jgi:DNA-binding MarR family transcriptional regulator
VNAPIGISFHPARLGPPSSTQLDNLMALLYIARDGVRIEQKAILDAADWLEKRGVLKRETVRVDHADRAREAVVVTLTDRGRALLEILWP